MNRFLKHTLCILACASLCLCACKEKPERHKKAQPQYDIEKVSKNIEHFTMPENQNEPSAAPLEINHKIIDLQENLAPQSDNLPAAKQAIQRCVISQFASDSTSKIARLSLTIRGIPKAAQDEYETRIINLLNAHAPQPWEIRKSSSIDKHENISAKLDVDFKKQTIRLKKASKTAAQRAEISFSFRMTFSAQGLISSWNNFNYSIHDEISVASEALANDTFWRNLEAQFPTLTAIDPDLTAQWLRTQGLSPLILNDGLSAFKHSDHKYYADGCLVARDEQQNWILRQLQSPYSPPQILDVPNIIDMNCSSNATFIVSAETPLRMALYYQPKTTSHAWKSQLTFADSIHEGDLTLHVDNDLVCLYTGKNPQQNRGVEIQCLDRKTGLMRWQTKRLSGALRGFAADDKQLVFANDQAVFDISRSGEIITFQPIQTSSRLRKRLSCQLQNRLIFMTGPGQFVSWNLDKLDFDWKAAVFDSDFIHCSQQNTLLFSEVGGYILAYDVEHDKPLWKYHAVSTPVDAFSYGNIIYLLFDKAVIALDRATGQLKAQIPLPWNATQFIQIGAKLYLNTKDAVYSWR